MKVFFNAPEAVQELLRLHQVGTLRLPWHRRLLCALLDCAASVSGGMLTLCLQRLAQNLPTKSEKLSIPSAGVCLALLQACGSLCSSNAWPMHPLNALSKGNVQHLSGSAVCLSTRAPSMWSPTLTRRADHSLHNEPHPMPPR